MSSLSNIPNSIPVCLLDKESLFATLYLHLIQQVPQLRKESRKVYLGKRALEKVDELKADIEDFKFLTSDIK